MDRQARLVGWAWRPRPDSDEASGFLLVDHPDLLAGLDRLGAAAVVVFELPAQDVDAVVAIAEQLRALAAYLDRRFGEDPTAAGLTALAHEKARELREIIRDLEDWK